MNNGDKDRYVRPGKVAALVDNLQQRTSNAAKEVHNKTKTAPFIPPKPFKKSNKLPQVPLSKLVTDTREPLYSQPLQSLDLCKTKQTVTGYSFLRKPPIHPSPIGEKSGCRKTTLDNPAVLEQQLEALAYHKQQMEKKGLLGAQSQIVKPQVSTVLKLSSTSLSAHNFSSNISNMETSLYSNLLNSNDATTNNSKFIHLPTHPQDSILYSNVQNAFCRQSKIITEQNRVAK